MQSREEAERQIDAQILAAKKVFNLLGSKINADQCKEVIRSLLKVSARAPDYNSEEVKSLLLTAYYYSAKSLLNSSPSKPLDHIDSFLKLGALSETHPIYKFYLKWKDDLMNLKTKLEEKIRDKYYEDMEHYAPTDLQKAVDAGKAFLENCPDKQNTDKRYNKVANIMLFLHGRLAAEREAANDAKAQAEARSEAIKQGIQETPAVRMYNSEMFPRPAVPRTPTPVTRSLHIPNKHDAKKMSKSHHEPLTKPKPKGK